MLEEELRDGRKRKKEEKSERRYEMRKISFSEISSYHWCPTRWQLKYKFGVKEPTNDYLILGQMLHEAIVEIPKEGGKVLKAYYDDIDTWYNKVDIHTLNKDNFADLFSSLFQIVFDDLTKNYALDKAVLEGEFERDFDSTHSLMGRIDYLTDNELVDYKFKKNFNNLKPLQLQMYRFIVNTEAPLYFQVYAWSGEKRKIQVPSMLDEMKDTVKMFILETESGEIGIPNRRVCNYCSMKDICPHTIVEENVEWE